MSKSVYFVSNNKKPNLKFYLSGSCVETFSTRKAARVELKRVKAKDKYGTLGGKYYRIFKVSAVSVR